MALWYARASARAAAAVAAIEEARHAAEVESMSSAELILRKARRAELILVTNAGQHPASNVSVRYEGLLFRTLVEDDEAGLTLMPGETLELMPLIDWEHPRNRHMRDRGGIMGVPSWPLTLSWVDGRGSHEVKRRVADARGQDSADAKPSGSAE